jgi:hypothetical protein
MRNSSKSLFSANRNSYRILERGYLQKNEPTTPGAGFNEVSDYKY